VEVLPALPDPVTRAASLAYRRQRPGGGGDRPGKVEDEVPGPGHRDPALNPWARLGPVAHEEIERARGEVGQADGERMLRRLGEADRLGFVLGRFSESAEFGEAHD